MDQQVDYRQHPSFGGDDPAPPVSEAPALDLGIFAEHPEDFAYNQLSLGIAPQIDGWSKDSWERSNPDVNPLGRKGR